MRYLPFIVCALALSLMYIGCAKAKRVCGTVVKKVPYNNTGFSGVRPGAWLAVKTDSGTVVQMAQDGVFEVGMDVCGEPQ